MRCSATRPRLAARLRCAPAGAQRASSTLPEAASLTAANKRIANILRKAPAGPAAGVDVEHLREDRGGAPATMRCARCRTRSPQQPPQRQYTAALRRLAQLRPAVDAFFDAVMVMDEDPQLRANRLALLAQLQRLFGGVADLSRLPG